jgi:hypothetical protein
MRIPRLRVLLFWTVWLGFGAVCWWTEFFVVYLVLTGFVLILTNLGSSRKPGELSAYSVFNPGQQRLLGTMTPEQLSASLLGIPGGAEMRAEDVGGDSDEGLDEPQARVLARSERRRNTVCHCGSGLKFKKCCGDPRLTQPLKYRYALDQQH